MFGRKKKLLKYDKKKIKPEYSDILKVENLVHEFIDTDDDGNITEKIRAVDNVSLEVCPGDFISILGHNGSGKSTLAKHINAILMPLEGSVIVAGMDTLEEDYLWDIRQTAGMVFQNPDNQIIATVVEEDVAFGPENLGIEREEIVKRVDYALNAVDMIEYRKHSPNRLSGGQKQRVAIAGIVAMHPEVIVLDEPTAMLDPNGRKEVLNTLLELNKSENVTIILITHFMDEVINSDKVFVMDDGKIALSGTPTEIFSEIEKIKSIGLDVPQVTEFAKRLSDGGIFFPKGIIDRDTFIEHLLKKELEFVSSENEYEEVNNKIEAEEVIKVNNISYTYSPETILRKTALKDTSLSIKKGEFIGIIGHTGSGKSTLIQHFNGLLKADKGEIYYKGENIYAKDYKFSDLRKKVGLVFQYPEYQLFDVNILSDAAFGPLNLGDSVDLAHEKAAKALEDVGISGHIFHKSPFELSGGQKRRAAIAGVLAMEPEVLILDEPTAALDPRGRDEIFAMLKRLHREKNITVILVSHSMEDVAKYVDRIIVMNKGEIKYDKSPKEVFSEYKELEKIGLAAPEITYILEEMRRHNFIVPNDITTVEKASEYILSHYKLKERI